MKKVFMLLICIIVILIVALIMSLHRFQTFKKTVNNQGSENTNSGGVLDTTLIIPVTEENIIKECQLIIDGGDPNILLSSKQYSEPYRAYLYSKLFLDTPEFIKIQKYILDKNCEVFTSEDDKKYCYAYLNKDLNALDNLPKGFQYYLLKSLITGENLCDNIDYLEARPDCSSMYSLIQELELKGYTFDKELYIQKINTQFIDSCRKAIINEDENTFFKRFIKDFF